MKLILWLLPLVLGAASAAQAASVFINTPGQLTPAQVFNLDISLLPQGDVLAGVDFNVLFDSTALQLNDVQFGAGLGSEFEGIHLQNLNAPGVLDIYALSFLSPSQLASLQTGSFNVATLTFTALLPGFSTVVVNTLDAVNAEGQTLALNSAMAQVQVVPLPAGFALLLAGMGGLLSIVRRRGELTAA